MGKPTEEVNFRSLKTIPIDVRKIITREQRKEQDKRGTQFSISSTIIKIIRSWEKKCNAE